MLDSNRWMVKQPRERRRARCEAKGFKPLIVHSVLVQTAMVAVAALAAGLFAAVPGYGDTTKVVDIVMKNGQVVGKKSIRVSKGDMVVLRWSSDKQLELHLHGYDITTIVRPGAPAEMKIQARATGRFPVEIHGHGGSGGGHGHGANTIFHLEVYPD